MDIEHQDHVIMSAQGITITVAQDGGYFIKSFGMVLAKRDNIVEAEEFALRRLEYR